MQKVIIILFTFFICNWGMTQSIQIVSPDKEDTFYLYPEDNHTSIQWGTNGTDVSYGKGAISELYGDVNTEDIVGELGSNSAAYICDTMTAYDTTTWYLPSIYELYCIYEQIDTSYHFREGHYWSSTEFSSHGAYGNRMVIGRKAVYEKDIYGRVRCIRK